MSSQSFKRAKAAFAVVTMIMVVVGAWSFLVELNASAGQPVSYLGPMQSTSGPVAPTSIVEAGWSPPSGSVIIDGVPSYIWYNGCGPTAVGMVVGYWDGSGFDDLVPGDAVVQTTYVDAMIASSEHIADYAYPYDNYFTGLLLDKSSLGGAHQSNCVADFMQTSWSSEGNYYGWTWSDMIDDGFSGYVQFINPSYSIATAWVPGNTLTWEKYVHEIDSKHPAVLLVDSDGNGYTDHFVTAIGYWQAGNTKMYACYDTWFHDVRWCEFAPMAKNQRFGIYDATFFELTKKEAYCASKTWGAGATSVSWSESVTQSYSFSILLDNNGFKSAVVEIFDTTAKKAVKLSHETVIMRSQNAYPFGWASTTPISLTASHTYRIWIGELDGPIGSYVFAYPAPPPVMPPVVVEATERVYFGIDLVVLGSNMYVLTWQYSYGPVWLYRSENGGATWSSPVDVFGYSITYADPGMCAYRDGDKDVILVASGPGLVAKSLDGGRTFTNLANLPGYWRFMTIGTRASWFGGSPDSDIFVIGSTAYSYGNLAFTKSADGGLTWSTPILIDATGACPEMACDGTNLYVAYTSPLPYDGALYVSKSSDWGATWSAGQILVQKRTITWNIRPYSFQYVDGQKALLTIRDQATTQPADNYGAYGYFDFATMSFQEAGRVDQTTWLVHEGFAGKLMPDGSLAVAWVKWTTGVSSQLMFAYI